MSRKSLTPIQLPADPVNALEATPKQYVDARAIQEVFVGPGTPPAPGAVSLTNSILWVDTDDDTVPTSLYQTYATKAALDGWTTAPDGAMAYTLDTKTQWLKMGGFWRINGGIRPSGHLYRTTAFSLPNATWTTVQWTTTAFVNFMSVNNATGFLTLTQPGLYVFSAQVWFSGGSGGNWRVAKIVNGPGGWTWAQAQISPCVQGPMFTLQGVISVPDPTGIQVTLQAYQDSGAAMNLLPSAANEIGTSLYVHYLRTGLMPTLKYRDPADGLWKYVGTSAGVQALLDNAIWNQGWGVVAKGTLNVTSAPTYQVPSGGTPTVAQVTYSVLATRRYRLRYVVRAINANPIQAFLMVDGVQVGWMTDPWFNTPVAWGSWGVDFVFDGSQPGAGSHTFGVRVQIGAGVGPFILYHDAASYIVLEDLGPISPGSLPPTPPTTGVTSPAWAGPRSDNAPDARFGNTAQMGNVGLIADSGGSNYIVNAFGGNFGVYTKDVGGGYVNRMQVDTRPHFNGDTVAACPRVEGAGATYVLQHRDNNPRELHMYAQTAMFGIWDSTIGDLLYLYQGKLRVLGGVEMGVHPIHTGYIGAWRDGGNQNQYAFIQDGSFNTLFNGGSSIGIRIANQERITIGNDVAISVPGYVYLNSPGAVYSQISGVTKLVVGNGYCEIYNDLRVDGTLFAQAPRSTTVDWGNAPLQTSGSNNTMPRLALWCPNIAPQLRANTAYGDHLEVINNPGSAYANIRAAAFPVASSLAFKEKVRPVRIRDLPPPLNHKNDDLVGPIDIMALRPIAYRPKVAATIIVPTDPDKEVNSEDPTTWKNEFRSLDTILGFESHRERLGLIAEEVENVLPSAVDHYEDGTHGAIDYAQIVVAMLDHVQRLTDEVSTLRYRISELENA